LKRNQLSKLAYGFQKTKESINSKISDLIGTYSSVIPYGAIVSTAAPFILNKAIPFIKNCLLKKKRQLSLFL
jgi:hypothetical protein